MSKTCFAIYIINLYISIPLRIAQTSTFPPPFNVLSMKINKKKCMTVIWGYGFIHTQKEKKKKLIIMMIMQNGTK